MICCEASGSIRLRHATGIRIAGVRSPNFIFFYSGLSWFLWCTSRRTQLRNADDTSTFVYLFLPYFIVTTARTVE